METWTVDVRLISEWLNTLDDESANMVRASIHYLEHAGPMAKRPLVGTIRGSRFPNMKELRPPSTGRSELRILFAFDPQRRAILLIAGDKANSNNVRKAFTWHRWYRHAIPKADQLFANHLNKSEERRS